VGAVASYERLERGMAELFFEDIRMVTLYRCRAVER